MSRSVSGILIAPMIELLQPDGARHAAPDWTPPNTLERVEVLGVAEPERVSLTHKGATRDLTFHMAADRNRRQRLFGFR